MSQGHNFLPKYLFVTNLLKAMKIRERVPKDVVKPSASGGVIHHLCSLHRHTVEMIPIDHYPEAFREVVQNAILDRSMQVSLQQERKLNWCPSVPKLVPLRTNGDGNCLLHAASQYMLGVQDTDLVLRKALHGALKETDTRNFRLRFQTELLQSQEFTQTGLRYNTRNWEDEWEKVVKMASTETSSHGLQYDSLEDIHIFVLSNILRRPIIVIADQVVRSMKSGSSFSPLNVGGVYLPLHWPPGECYRYPIVLGYDSQHFAPLITIQDSGAETRAVPLAYLDKGTVEELKVHFLLEKEQQHKDQLLKDYLMLTEMTVNGYGYSTAARVKAARLDEGNLPKDMNLMEDYMQLVVHEYNSWQRDKESPCEPRREHSTAFSMSQLSLIEIRCATPRCTFYISVDTQPHCHECYEKRRADRKAITGHAHEPEPRPRPTPDALPGPCSSPGASPRSAPPTAPSLSLYSETHAMKCKTPGCLFTLSVERDGLCERCYNARLPRPAGPAHRCLLCQQEAFRLFNGLCPACLQRTAQEPERPTPEWPPHGGLEEPVAQQGRLCRRSGCIYFGTPQQHGFCSICYEDYQINHRTEPAAGQRRSPPPARACVEAGAQNAPRCRALGCNSSARASYEGFCKRCFVKEQSARLGQTGPRAPQSPPPPLAKLRPRPCGANPAPSSAAPQGLMGLPVAFQRDAPPRQSLYPVQCSRSGCRRYFPGWTELCTECQPRSRRDGHRAGGGGGGHHAREEVVKLQRCRTQCCDHYANQEKRGYCNECDLFMQIYRG